jgi:multiple sugar transport system substrate-binding protein
MMVLVALLMLAVTLSTVVIAQDEPNTDLSGELDLMGFGLGDEIATVRADYAQAQIPNVTVNFIEGGFDAQQFLTSVASGTPPDLVYIDRQTLGTYAANGTFMPLADCIANQGIDMSQYREVAVNQVTIDGEIYGIPEFFNNLMLIINTAALENAGLTLDDIDTSNWEQLAELNTALTVGTGNDLTRIGFDPKLPEFLPLWVRANGGMMLSEDGRTAMLNSPEVVEALTFAVSLLDTEGGWAPFKAFRDTWDFFGGNNQVVADQIGVWPMEQWYRSKPSPTKRATR